MATVGALLRNDDGEVLVVKTHKWGHRWGIPGGKIRRGEGSVEALKREMLEETGLTITDPRFVMVQDSIDSEEFERKEHFLLLNYVANVEPGEVRLNDEAQEFRWLAIRDALELDLNVPTRVLLEELAVG